MDKFMEIFNKAVKAVTDFALGVARTTAKTMAKGTEKVGSFAADKVCKEVKAHKKEVSKGVMIGAGAIALLAAAFYIFGEEE